jgi:hypothetical protein
VGAEAAEPQTAAGDHEQKLAGQIVQGKDRPGRARCGRCYLDLGESIGDAVR